MKSFLEQFLNVRTLLKFTAIAALLVFTAYMVRWMGKPTFGFGMYYAFSRMVLNTEDLAKAYDFDYFNSRMHNFGIPGIDMPNNMPTGALPMLPIAWLDAGTAKTAWMLISAGLFVWSLRKLFTVYGIPITQNLGLGLVTFVFVFRPLYEGMALGQMYFLILWLFVLGMPVATQEKTYRVTVPLAIILAIKGYGIVQLLWFAFRKNWRVPTMAVLGTILIILLTLPLMGSNSWIEFLHSILSEAGSPKGAHVSYQSLNGFLHHFLTFDPTWSPSPLLALPGWSVLVLSSGGSLLLIAFVLKLRAASGEQAHALSYSASIAVGVITFPPASEYHYVLFLPLIVGLATTLYRLHTESAPASRFLVSAVVASSLLMAAPIKYQQLQESGSLMGLLAYPKLYAGISLVLCFTSLMRRMGTRDHTLMHVDCPQRISEHHATPPASNLDSCI